MDQTLLRTRKSWLRWLAPAAAILLVAACATPERAADYRQNAKITVGKETVSLTVAVPAAGAGLAGLEATKFEQFVRRYIESGQGQMTGQASAHAPDRARQLLEKEGVRGREIVVQPAAGDAASAVLTYTAATVAVPECEDWSANETFNWSNRVHSNFGCATRRNIGLMVRDPADLEKSKDMSGADAEHGAGVITNYRKAPTVTGAGATKQKSAVTNK